MTMKLANTHAKLLALLVMSLCFVSGAWAQGMPAKKPATSAKAAKPAKAAVAAKSAKTAPSMRAAKTPPAPDAAGADAKTETAGKRDPFAPLINDKKDTGAHLPPGKAGLVIATVRVDGAVRGAGGMIAVVSNPEQSVYFIREGDQLYDGDVEKIGLDGVTFRENSKDAFGKPVERVVTKRIYESAGEQQ
jgi:hypothetical protein